MLSVVEAECVVMGHGLWGGTKERVGVVVKAITQNAANDTLRMVVMLHEPSNSEFSQVAVIIRRGDRRFPIE
jgi:hypothetical protein